MRRHSARSSRRTRLALAGCATLLVALAPAAADAQRDAFIEHTIGLHTALGSTYGDEGPRILARIDGMAAALRVWDTSVGVATARYKDHLEGASADIRLQAHTTLASEHLNRSQFHDGLHELDAAIVIEPRRSELHLLRGRLLDAMGRAAEAPSAYMRAWELDPFNAVKAYLAISSERDPGEDVPESPQRLALIDAHRRGTRLVRDGDGTRPIVELSLIADGASSRPIFVPALYSEGFRLIAAGRYREAIDHLRDAAANDPLVVDPVSKFEPMWAAVALLREGRFRAAIPLLESAATAHPRSSEVQRILGTACGAAGEDVRAIAHLRSALRLAPSNERAHLALGKRLRDAGQLSEAEQALRDAARSLPESGEVRWLLADLLERAGRGLDAARELEAAASLTMLAGKAAVYVQAAEIYYRYQDFDRMVDLLREPVRLDPNNAAAHKGLGLAQTWLGRHREATAELVLADLLGDGDIAVLSAIGQNHRAANRFEDAEAVLRRAVKEHPEQPQIRFSLGQTLQRLGRTDDAREQFDAFQRLRDRAMEDQRRTFELDKLRADAVRHTSSGRHDMAAAALEALVEQLPAQVDLRLALADALTRSRRVEDAVRHLEKAAALGAGPDVYRRLAEAYAELGRGEASERASQIYEQRLREYGRAPAR